MKYIDEHSYNVMHLRYLDIFSRLARVTYFTNTTMRGIIWNSQQDL